MNIWTDWPTEATFGDDLEALLEAVQFRAINADVEQYRHYSRLFERLQSVRSEYRQNLAAADWEDMDWAFSAIEDTDVTGDYDV